MEPIFRPCSGRWAGWYWCPHASVLAHFKRVWPPVPWDASMYEGLARGEPIPAEIVMIEFWHSTSLTETVSRSPWPALTPKDIFDATMFLFPDGLSSLGKATAEEMLAAVAILRLR